MLSGQEKQSIEKRRCCLDRKNRAWRSGGVVWTEKTEHGEESVLSGQKKQSMEKSQCCLNGENNRLSGN